MRMCKIFILAVLFSVLSCSEKNSHEDDCNPDNPLSMGWMNDWVADLQYCACTISIFQANYLSEPVFWQLMTDPLCQTVFTEIQILDCTGEIILTIDCFENLQEFQENVQEMKIIYQCEKP